MNSDQFTKTAVDSRASQLKAILYLLQTNLEEFRDEVERGYELLNVGEKTELSKEIENSIEDPLTSIFRITSNIDHQVKEIVDRIVKSFLRNNAPIILKAYRARSSMNDLHYSIVLKNDNINNRSRIFDFFDKYDLLEISSKYPVYFQFVPVEFADKMHISESLNLSEV